MARVEERQLLHTKTLPPTPPDSSCSVSSTSDSTFPPFPLPPVTSAPKEILEVDKKTPDSHVARDPRLIRLTGVHPFNVEAPLSALFGQGFLTSPELFYVRNHGAVPKVADEDVLDWELSIEGLVQNPMRITFRDLLHDYDNFTYPITLVCAGNRRKEQNVVRKSKGFSWGPAGVSTALFTGILMSDVIGKAQPLRRARYVCMEGADKLPNGYYGTSVKLSCAMDPNRGVMLAHGMNGEMLRPDHGKPLRAVIPGQIGGRSVKWLTKLILTSEPSDNWYHIYDNRVLPTMVSPEESANNPSWWKDDRYAIYDLSPNSAIAYPAHDERVKLDGPSTYSVQGYAYTGGGRRVTRVEISTNQGNTWMLAEIDYAEDRYRDAEPQNLFNGMLDFGLRDTSFCWCFWKISVSINQLAGAQDIVVRAMDDSMNIQPKEMYWSVLGMMNNPWYRIVIIREQEEIRFEHPTQPALIPGGWMERVKKAGGDLTDGFWGERLQGSSQAVSKVVEQAEITMTKNDIHNEITIDELRKHDTEESPWFVIDGQVFNGSKFLDEHPGGAQSIVSAAGMDVTDEFMAIHSETAKAMMPQYHIGTLDEKAKKSLGGDSEDTILDLATRSTFLDARAWTPAKLHSKTVISWDTRIFRFKLGHAGQRLGLPTGQHLMARLRDPATREVIIRSYTPISEVTEQGYVDILIKIYFDSKERSGGRMTKALDALPVGHPMDLKGPIGKFEYLGCGACSINGRSISVTRLIMICGGSGVTPIYQVLRAVMQNHNDPTRCVVLDGNRLLEDILCKSELDAFASSNPEKCELLYTLTQAPENWDGLKGRIAEPLLRKYAIRHEQAMVLICGPESMEKSVHKILQSMGWNDSELVFF